MATRFERYPPIGYYSLLGDLRSAALLSKEGSIDWMCLPRFDSPWIFGRLLDWDRGGYFEVRPDGPAECDRTYRTISNAMETRWWDGHRRLRVVDVMPVVSRTERDRPPPSVRLLRFIVGVAGTMDWRATFRPRFDFGRREATIRRLAKGVIAARHGGDQLVLEFPADAAIELSQGTAVITGRAAPGQQICLVLHYLESARRPSPVSYVQADHWLHATDAFWASWLRASGYHGRYLEQSRRSALTLKLLQYEPTGAFIAAPTTSLPESPGGSLNWDYRYSWLRDSAILVHALLELGFEEEADRFIEWLIRVHDRTRAHKPSQFQILYRVDGDPNVPESTIDELDGYRGARPVRVGNAAVDQVQLDVYGELIETAYVGWLMRGSIRRGGRIPLLAIIDYVLEHWQDEDSGIWEARSRKRRYLYSQVMCWVAMDRALRMDRSLRLGGRRRRLVGRTRARIKADILNRGYNHELGAFTQALDHPELDASALYVLLSGLLPPTDARVISTVDTLWSRLGRKGLLYRYAAEESEFQEPEGAFLVCTAWMIRALCRMGRTQEADALFSRLTETANDLGLFSEEFDPEREIMLGNFPQALSHLALIRAALELEGRQPRPTRGARKGRRRGGPTKAGRRLTPADSD
jgi:GH15 family glucan-1,4-alpha-glucosidase